MMNRLVQFLKSRRLVPVFVADLVRLIRQPGYEYAVWKDLIETRRSARFLRNGSLPSGSGKTVLVLSLATSIYQLKVEAMVAMGLRLRGWRPVVLTTSHYNSRARRYFGAFGITDFVNFDDFDLTAEEQQQCAEAAQRLIDGGTTVKAVKTWTFHDSWIGPQLISTISRYHYQGKPDLADPSIQRQLVETLPAVMERVLLANKIIDAVQPDIAYAIEANYVKYGPLVDAAIARGTNVVQVTQPWRDDALMFKRLTKATRREHPSSLSQRSLDLICALPWTETMSKELDDIFHIRSYGGHRLSSINQQNVRPFKRKDIIETLDLDPSKKIAVLFSHLLWDANLFYGHDLFENLGDWFIESVKAACANPDVNWVVKLHPANIFKMARDGRTSEYDEIRLIQNEIGELPPHVKILFPDTPISSLSLYQSIDYVVTVRGTVSVEAPCFGIPVIKGGTGRVTGFGFTLDPESREEYLGLLASISSIPPLTPAQIQRARQHAYAAFCCRPWVMKSFRSQFNSMNDSRHPLGWNLHLRARSLDEIERHRDLHKFSQWFDDLDSVDFLDIPSHR